MKYDEYKAIASYIAQRQTSVSPSPKSNSTTEETMGLLLDQLKKYDIKFANLLDTYDKQRLIEGIKTPDNFLKVEVYLHVLLDSTNVFLKQLTSSEKKVRICLAEKQTKGRGRRGKEWFSPFGSNVCLSIRRPVNITPKASGGISLVVGISIVQALESLGYVDLKIKWPNDIYYMNKKLSGVLIEVVSVKHDFLDVVIGIGMNVNVPASAMSTVEQAWVNLAEIPCDSPAGRNDLVIAIVNHLNDNLSLLETKGLSAFKQSWKRYDLLFGKSIKVMQEDNSLLEGEAIGISDTGQLLLKRTNNMVLPVSAGEVSVRLSGLMR